MIEYLTGHVLHKLPNGLILDVQGVGYGLTLPLSAVAELPGEGQSLGLWVYTRVREDAIQLYGFFTRQERQAFEILIQINGVGPKVAIAILSTLPLARLRQAVEARQTEILQMVPGIGKRTAEKILLELAAKLDKLPLASPGRAEKRAVAAPFDFAAAGDAASAAWAAHVQHDLKSALANLGFKDKDVEPLLAQLALTYEGEDFSTLVRKALALLGKRQESKLKKHPSPAHKSELDLDQIF